MLSALRLPLRGGRQAESGEIREQKGLCGTKTLCLCPFHLFPLLPKAPLLLSYKT